MVRSHWIGPVFGVVALTGLALGQTAIPLVPVSTGDAEGQVVTVQEAGKPAQKCQVLKTWTEPDGTRAYQARALDTGELMTIEGAPPSAPAARGGPVRAAAMRIFHWGRRGEVAPSEAPEPPPDTVVVEQKPVLPPAFKQTPAVRVEPISGVSGSTTVTKFDESPYAPAPNVLPSTRSIPVTAVAPQPEIILPPPPATCNCAPSPSVCRNCGQIPVSIAAVPVQAPRFKLLDPTTWRRRPATEFTPNDAAGVIVKAPADAPKADASPKVPSAVAKVEVTPAQPGDWRESWGKIEPSRPPQAKADAPPAPVALPAAKDPPKYPDAAPPAPTAAAPKAKPDALSSPAVATLPKYPGATPPPTPAALAAGKTELPHAVPKADDPLKDPEKYTKLPRPEGSFGPGDAAAKNKSMLALLTGKQPPTKAEDKKADGAAAVPLGMKSAAAAGAAVPSKSARDASMGFDPNEPNAFSDPKTAKKPTGSNAFTDPPPPPPAPPDPQAVALAGNAFVNAERPPLSGPPVPHVPDSGLPTRYLPPPAPYPAQAPAAPPSTGDAAPKPLPVAPVGYRPGSAYDVTPLVAVLRESLYPSQREEAAEQLGALDWRRQPEVVDVLVDRARQDPAPTVRAECVRSLGRMKANTLPAVEAVKALQSDDDLRVRHEADDAYITLTGATSKAGSGDTPVPH